VTIDGLILAAGESRRMGSIKPLLGYRGQTFLDNLIERFAPFCRTTVAVVGAHADEIIARTAPRAQVQFVHNNAYREGQLSSLQAGLRALHDPDYVLMTLADHPSVNAQTIEALIAEPAPIVIPRYCGGNGHPILFSRAISHELLALAPFESAKHVIRLRRDVTRFVEVADAGILQDIDDPAAYQVLLSASGGA
jgi:molybdenum cofactor cytidylyltransferase